MNVPEVNGREECRFRLVYSKTGRIRFISHRDLIRVFFRTFARAGLPLAYSRGYSPHPRVSFCPPLKVGMEGLAELLDLTLIRPIPERAAAATLNRHLPEGIRIKEARLQAAAAPSLSSMLGKAEYRVALPDSIRIRAATVEKFLAAAEVGTARRPGELGDSVNARRGVLQLEQEGEDSLRMVLSLRDIGRPYPVMAVLAGVDISLLTGWRWQRLGFPP